MSTCTCSFTATEEFPARDLHQAAQCPSAGGVEATMTDGVGPSGWRPGEGRAGEERAAAAEVASSATGSATAVAARRMRAVAGGLGAAATAGEVKRKPPLSPEQPLAGDSRGRPPYLLASMWVGKSELAANEAEAALRHLLVEVE
ncbi:unnamed protein product [Miscanthus lutarioriparius]|uniref:Uncharacterized protein n=1 Tax=Miscanthus lutarioriparius TaxID=422564 RepID=A0A811RZB7_9POAL|nr:unnamed protein product [Miscanthus lutarioriparius]